MIPTRIDGNVTMPDPPQPARRFSNGDEILGRYVVESELGQGGMGVVYKCFDKVGGVEVAVKGLPPEVSHNSDEMEAVRENFQLVSELHHSNIAGVRTLEKDAVTGDYYLVMTLARGVSLRHWLRQHGGREHRAEQLNVLRQIASALDYAHNAEPKHIIHRDIKPENIMVDERGNVSVLDFGLAAQVRSSLSRVSQVVTSRSGTPAYKSPEQWLAQAQRAPSDQYSLGVIAYQMITGELPFDSDDLEILKHAVVFDPVPELADEGKDVNLVLARALAKKPQERFASCVEFVDALKGRCADEDANKTLNDADESSKEKGKLLAGCIWTVIALVALAFGGWWWLGRDTVSEAKTIPPVKALPPVKAVTPIPEVTPVPPEVTPAPVVTQATAVVIKEKDIPPKTDAVVLTNANRVTERIAEDRHHVDDVRVEATVKIQACRRIDGGDGFKRLKDECEDTFTRAGAEYELGRWLAAATVYSNLIVQVEKLERLDEGRRMAAAARIRAESAAKVHAEKTTPPAPAVVQVQLPQPDKEVARREVKMSALLESAKEYAEKERWKECLAAVNAVLELNPNNKDAKQLKWRAQNGIETANSPMFATPQNTLRGGRGANGLEPLNQDMPKDDWRHQQGTKFFK